MGSENLFHKRRAQIARELTRHRAKRDSYDRVLIVCEGAKTEPNYLRGLIDDLELNTANIEVDGDCGSSPISVVKHSIKRYKEEKSRGDAYDHVYCVFDKDAHTSYSEALDKIANTKPKDVFHTINSVPCFEYWLLLHFEYTTREFTATGTKSRCDNLIDVLKPHISGYTKGARNIYQQLSGQTSQAITNSKGALTAARTSGTDNPTTLMHELVEYLQNLKAKANR